MIKIVVAALCVVAAFTAPTCATTMEVMLIRYDSRKLYLEEKFEQLDALIDTYRKTDARLASGNQKINQVYTSLLDSEWLVGSWDYAALGKVQSLAEKWVAAQPEFPAARIVFAKTVADRGFYVLEHPSPELSQKEQKKAARLFFEQANAYLEQYKTLASADPEWFVLKLRVMVQLVDKADLVPYAEEALARYPHDQTIQWMILRTSERRWGGSLDWFNYWLDRIAAADSKQSYARAYRWDFDETFWSKPYEVDWEKLKPGFEEMVSVYPVAWNLNSYAYFACVAKDAPKLRELLTRIGKNIDPEAWKVDGMLADCRHFAETAPPREEYLERPLIVVEAYDRKGSDGHLELVLGVRAASEEAAVEKAKQLAPAYEGVRAYSLKFLRKQTMGRPVVLFRHGTIPPDWAH